MCVAGTKCARLHLSIIVTEACDKGDYLLIYDVASRTSKKLGGSGKVDRRVRSDTHGQG